MNASTTTWIKLLVATVSLVLPSCANLRPVVENVRYFVLTPVPMQDSRAFRHDQSLGIAPVVVPDYLQQKRIAFSRGSSEIAYSGNLYWAERFDKNIQRVLAADLASFFGSTNVYLSAWRRNEVGAEIYISFKRFELDQQGQARLDAAWRITTPGSKTITRAGNAKISRQGPALSNNPDKAVQILSAALGELSREIAVALESTRASPGKAPP